MLDRAAASIEMLAVAPWPLYMLVFIRAKSFMTFAYKLSKNALTERVCHYLLHLWELLVPASCHFLALRCHGVATYKHAFLRLEQFPFTYELRYAMLLSQYTLSAAMLRFVKAWGAAEELQG